MSSSTGLSENIGAFLSYLFGWLSGLILFLVEKDNKPIRFHAAQSIILFLSLLILIWVTSMISTTISSLLASATGIIWIVMLVLSLLGKAPRLPLISGVADSMVSK